MRSHPDVKNYCGKVTDDVDHGIHYIDHTGKCSKCEELGLFTTLMGRCSEETVCGPCNICKVCEKEERCRFSIANPTTDEIEKAIPYSTDILKDFLKT